MELHHQILLTVYHLAKDDPQPVTYLCRPRQLLLRLLLDWSVIQENIARLEEEGMVVTKQLDTLVISITTAGIERIGLLEENVDAG